MRSSFGQSKDKTISELDCSAEFAEGYLDGKMYRRHSIELPERFQDGMDEYAKGFRAGYYVEACSVPTEVSDEKSTAEI